MDAPVLHIEIDTEGIPRTINRRVKVQMIAQMHLIAGEKIETIAQHYELSVADVYAALVYYYDNRADFDQRERELRPLIKDAKRYTEALNANIRQRMSKQG